MLQIYYFNDKNPLLADTGSPSDKCYNTMYSWSVAEFKKYTDVPHFQLGLYTFCSKFYSCVNPYVGHCIRRVGLQCSNYYHHSMVVN